MHTSPLQKFQTTPSQQAGFSLIEVLVSLAIFAVVVTMSVGTMIVMIDANSKAQFSQSISSNMAFALDSMTRDIRTGTDYRCSNSSTDGALQLNDRSNYVPNDCMGGRSAFAFTESGGSLTTGLASNRIGFRHRTVDGVGRIERKLSTDGGPWQAITSENVNITELTFTVRNTNTSDSLSPQVTIYIKGEGVGDIQDTEFVLQTTITQRALDI